MISHEAEAAILRYSVKMVFLEISQDSQENICAGVSFLISNFIEKETLAQVFFCEFCKISKNSFFSGTHPLAASSATEVN